MAGKDCCWRIITETVVVLCREWEAWAIYIEIILRDWLYTFTNNSQKAFMPFKVKLIKQFQKYVKTNSEIQNTIQPLILLTENEAPNKNKKHRKKFVSKTYNVYQHILRCEVAPQQSIANFYNILAINELAVRQQRGEESYFKALFYIKNIKKVEIREKYLLLSLSDSPLQFPPIELTLERYRSFGDIRFYHLAGLMVEAASRLRAIEKLETKPGLEDSADFIEKYTQSLSNKTYVFRTASNKIVLSKSLLELLQIDPQEFAIESIKYRAPIYEPASTEKYYEVMVKYFQNLRNLLDLISDRISLEAFLDNSVIRFKDTFYTKRNKRLYCKVKVGMPSPLVNIFEVQQVISRTDEVELMGSSGRSRKQFIDDAKQNMYSSEIQTVRSLLKLPKNLLPENLSKVVHYQQAGDKPKDASHDQ